MSSAKRSTRSQARSRRSSKDSLEQNGDVNIDKTVTAATVTSAGLGPKQMTLYLSRTTSMLKPGSASHNKADGTKDGGKEEKRDSLPVVNGQNLSHTAFQREFTFTGYDIMSDNEPVKDDKLDDIEKEKRANVQCYLSACRHLGHTPVSFIAKHINDPNFAMKCHPLGSEGARAICIALVSNRMVQSLNLENDDIGPDGAVYIADMLKENDTLTQIHIGENLIGTRGIYALTELLKSGKKLHTLDVSGSNLEDSDAKYIAEIMEVRVYSCFMNVPKGRATPEETPGPVVQN